MVVNMCNGPGGLPYMPVALSTVAFTVRVRPCHCIFFFFHYFVCGTVRTTRTVARIAWRSQREACTLFASWHTAALIARLCGSVMSGTVTTGVGKKGMLSSEQITDTSFCKKGICAKSLLMHALRKQHTTVPSRLACCGGGGACVCGVGMAGAHAFSAHLRHLNHHGTGRRLFGIPDVCGMWCPHC